MDGVCGLAHVVGSAVAIVPPGGVRSARSGSSTSPSELPSATATGSMSMQRCVCMRAPVRTVFVSTLTQMRVGFGPQSNQPSLTG